MAPEISLIHGDRAVERWSDRRDDAVGRWVRQIKERRGTNIATVALANKMARIGWRIVALNEEFDVNKAFRSVRRFPPRDR